MDKRPRCESSGKAIFDTYEEANLPGQYAYQCKSCGTWHRSGSALKIARQIERGPRPGGLYYKPGRIARARRAR